ncbi:hypothetical protein [Actinomadura rubrisoli]|uniref:Uncharacterized protein n=1 Tax=Actinomadura rubrisoli TaxID=2530368 RepID=A0A4R5CBY7_9ACTN|nr:hypothetical protein [Actinomadura rubrisoli]TDD94654.1 hypothetical protein E1298_06635 [Actinomadura rubrisoli]
MDLSRRPSNALAALIFCCLAALCGIMAVAWEESPKAEAGTTVPPAPEPGAASPETVAWATVAADPPGDPAQGRPNQQWLDVVNSRDCEAMPSLTVKGDAPGQVVYGGLAQACLAVTRNQAGAWGQAAHALANVQKAPASCTDDFAYRLLRDLVLAHLRQPDRQPVVTSPKNPHVC